MSHRARGPAGSFWLVRPIRSPTAVSRSFTAALNAHSAIPDQAGQRVDPPLPGARVRQRFQPLPRPGGQILATRDDAIAGISPLIHAVFSDLHDRVACPHASTVRFRPVSRVSLQTG
jgi:hypothetical protein